MNWYSNTDFIVGSASTPDAGVQDGRLARALTPRLFLAGAQPVRAVLRMRIELPAAARVQLAVYDVMGRRMRTIVDRVLPAGGTAVNWDGRDGAGAAVCNGIYFVRLSSSSGNRALKTVLMR